MVRWVISVVGVAVLSVLSDVILPEGQTRKYVRTVLGIVITLVIVQPVLELIKEPKLSVQSYQLTQQQYLDSVESRQRESAEQNLLVALQANGVAVKDVEVTEDQVVVTISSAHTAQTENLVRQIVASGVGELSVEIVWV